MPVDLSVKSALEDLFQFDVLQTHPLAQTTCIRTWVAQHPLETAGKSEGGTVALALAAYWRSEFRPDQVPPLSGQIEPPNRRSVIALERFLFVEMKYFQPLRQGGGRPLHDEEVLSKLQDVQSLGSVLIDSGTRLGAGWEQYLEQTIVQRVLQVALGTYRDHRYKAVTAFEERLIAIEEGLRNQEVGQLRAETQQAAPSIADNLLATALEWSILGRRATGIGTLEVQIRDCLFEGHLLDRALIKGFAEQVDHELLHFVAISLALRWKHHPPNSPYPVLIDLSQYAPRANTESLIGYAASRWLSDRCSDGDERAAFRATLADLEAKGRILWIAGIWDALTAEETKHVLPRFREVGHYIVVTRAWEPYLDFNQRCELPVPAIENPGRFIRERLEITPSLSGDLQTKLARLAYFDLDRGTFRTPNPHRLIFKENEVRHLDPANRHEYLEQARRAGIILYDGVNFCCDAGVANYLAAIYALLDPFCDHFDIVEIALRRHEHPLLRGVVQVFAHTQDWLLLDQVIQAFAALSCEGPRRNKVETLGLSVLTAADLVAQIRQAAKSPLPEEHVQRMGDMLRQLAAVSSSPEVHVAVAQRLHQLGLTPQTMPCRPAEPPIVAPPRPQAAAVSELLAQLGATKLADRVTRGADWTTDFEIIARLVAALRQPNVSQDILAACLYHADLSQRLLPQKGGIAGFLEEPPVAFEYLVNLALTEPNLLHRRALLSTLARPEILRYLARCKESVGLRSLMQSIALILDAHVIYAHGETEVFVRT